MKLIKPSYKILESQGYLKDIERAGRVCYKSEDKITEDSAKGFVDRMVKSGHGAMLEHGTIYLTIPNYDGGGLFDSVKSLSKEDFKAWCILQELSKNPYTKINNWEYYYYVTTNYRVIIENKLEYILKYLSTCYSPHEKRISVKFICDRGVWNEFIRHRSIQKIDEDDFISFGGIGEDSDKFSFAQESTRYCNYSKDKFGNELTFIIPYWLDISEGIVYNLAGFENSYSVFELNDKEYNGLNTMKKEEDSLYRYLLVLDESESNYMGLLNNGWTPQQARSVLPNSLKMELIMTGFVSDWKHFFELRDDKLHAHPQAYELAHPLHEEFIKRGLL